MRTCKGFTLIELMVTITVLAILVGIAIPSFRNIIDNNRSLALAQEGQAALQYARSEAVKRKRNVTICRSVNKTACENGTDWSVGWLVREVGGDILKVGDAATGMTVSGPSNGVVFQSSGMAAAAANFSFATSICTTTVGSKRAVSVSLTGSASITNPGCP